MVDAVAASPWVLVLVFVVAGLDAVVPLSPSESTLIAVAVVSAQHGTPAIGLVILAAAGGALAGDAVAYRIGVRAGAGVLRRLQGRVRATAAFLWARRVLGGRGGQVIVFARYLPGGRSATALAAGVVGYPAGRFHAWTAVGVSLWATMAGLVGYGCGLSFPGQPWKALLLAYAGAGALLAAAELLRRVSGPGSAEARAPGSATARGSVPESESELGSGSEFGSGSGWSGRVPVAARGSGLTDARVAGPRVGDGVGSAAGAADEEVDPRAGRGDGQGQGGLLQHDHGAARADLADHAELESGST